MAMVVLVPVVVMLVVFLVLVVMLVVVTGGVPDQSGISQVLQQHPAGYPEGDWGIRRVFGAIVTWKQRWPAKHNIAPT